MRICSLTDIGIRREMNQDYFYSSDDPVGNLPSLFLVADGMGGHTSGEFASRFTVETVVDQVRNSRQKVEVKILRDAIQTANRKLFEYAEAHPDMIGMGTTIVAATIEGANLLVANVGDSRLYLVGQELTQVTKDHSLVQEMVRNRQIPAEEAHNHPDKNIITRAIGVEASVQIDFFECVLEAGERILLCSDGFSNMLSEEDILGVLHGPEDLETKTEKLVDMANAHGGMDNITVIIIEPDTER